MAKSKAPGPSLFPILQTQPRLTALGRAAMDAEQIDAGHDVTFRSLRSRSILNPFVSKRMNWAAWSINPYRGCEFGCRYCYARYTHEFLAPAEEADGLRRPEAFEREIFVKESAAWLLEQDLRRLAKQGRLHEEMALGTATDPWQPIERRTELTRGLLQVLARRSDLRLGVVTKSTLIERDLDLLQEIHHRSVLTVHITITTPDAELARKLEPRAPRPDLRFRTVQRLREAGIRTGILNSPLLPGITDGAAEIDRMAACAADAGASFFAAMPLFLKSCSRPTYFAFLRDNFPHLQASSMGHFRETDFAAPHYREHLRAMVKASCIRYGLRERRTDNLLTRDVGEQGPNAKKMPTSELLPVQAHLFG